MPVWAYVAGGAFLAFELAFMYVLINGLDGREFRGPIRVLVPFVAWSWHAASDDISLRSLVGFVIVGTGWLVLIVLGVLLGGAAIVTASVGLGEGARALGSRRMEGIALGLALGVGGTMAYKWLTDRRERLAADRREQDRRRRESEPAWDEY